MGDKETDRFVDELLDASLRQYQSEEPRAGLEGRVLAQVRARERAAKARRWVWALGAAATVMIVAAAISVLRRQPWPAPPPAPLAANKPAPPGLAPRATSTPPKAIQHARRATVAERRPEQFPTPRPLTEQEKLLLLYVKSTPSSELQAQAEQRPMADLEIPKISIAALEIKPLPEAGNGQEN